MGTFENSFSPIDRFCSAVDLIENQLSQELPNIATYMRKYDSLLTLEDVIKGKYSENPNKAKKYIELIKKLKETIIVTISNILGFTVLDKKRVFPQFIKLLESLDLENCKFEN